MRRGISLLEVLISMFVLLFGLMGVAAIFPVGNHYAGKSDQYDRGSVLTDQAFAELEARGMLSPYSWVLSEAPDSADSLNPSTQLHMVIQQPESTSVNKSPGMFGLIPNAGQGNGHAFIIDPLGTAAARQVTNPAVTGYAVFPFQATDVPPSAPTNPWLNRPAGYVPLLGNMWPMRRVTLPAHERYLPSMTPAVADTIFRLRDDATNELPEQDDRPGIAAWTVDRNNTPDLTSDDIPLARSYSGAYSWLATVVPSAGNGTNDFQPKSAIYPAALFDVSVVIFKKRDVTPSFESERIIEAELIDQNELVIYANSADQVDAAVKDVFPSNWACLVGTRPNGKFLMKWYRLDYIDDETLPVAVDPGNRQGRQLTLNGPEWPDDSFTDLRLVILPGTISVSTRTMHLPQ